MDAAESVADLDRGLQCPIVKSDLHMAEMIKYASNSFLAIKVSFINEIASIREKLGTDVKEIARKMGNDRPSSRLPVAFFPSTRSQCRMLGRRTFLRSILVAGLSLLTARVATVYAEQRLIYSDGLSNRVYLPIVSAATPESTSGSDILFGTYPGGGTGETPNAPVPSLTDVSRKMRDLSGDSPFLVHLYTAWSWYDPSQIDAQVAQFAGDGFQVILTIKYSPPSGHDGDVSGYVTFVQGVVSRYATNPGVVAFVIGNEANVTGDPTSSDGAFVGAQSAVTQGVVAARQKITGVGSSAQVGVNFAVTGVDSDRVFLQDLAQQGGDSFAASVQFVGIDTYPGLWPAGTGTPYQEMRDDLLSARQSVDGVASLRGLPIDVLEVGAPSVSEQDQAERVQQFVQATRDARQELAIRSFVWFDLWDSNSNTSNIFDHYGLLRSDLSPKAAYQALQGSIATAIARPPA